VVEPYCGYGWHLAPKLFADNRGIPPPFHLQVVRVYSYKGERRVFWPGSRSRASYMMGSGWSA
jgi:hypothetical protein